MLHAAFTDGPRVLCGEFRAHVQHTKHAGMWEGAARTGGVCRMCDGKHLVRITAPVIWPHIFGRGAR